MRKTKKQYGNLNEKDAVDNKKFWKTVKLILSDKIKSNEKITIVEDGNLYPRHQSSWGTKFVLFKHFSNENSWVLRNKLLSRR